MNDEEMTVGPLHNLEVRRVYEPHLLVALPEGLADDLPMDGLLAEWAASLDPIGALRDAAQQTFADRWMPAPLSGIDWWIADDVVEAAPDVVISLRAGAKDEGVLAAMNAAEGDLVQSRDGDRSQIKTLSTYDTGVSGYRIGNAGMPVVVGLSVLASVITPVGPCGRRVALELAEARSRSS